MQWWFVNSGSDSAEISLVRTKSMGTDFHVRTYGRFSNPEYSLIQKYWIDSQQTCPDKRIIIVLLTYDIVVYKLNQ